ncbi:hypothetical protein JCM19232_4740 [Vibrio ishigakensis]|uniref:Uncharacterized protein n=1 Tax=Vibrio ishigakensis TaxID=1481914 RepID=A0A0B8PJ23_9VIBR|nr:hypothetical protein JCM19232_4740 [Vibrio ishigakensis]
MLDKLEHGAEKQGMQHIVDTAECGDWRQYFISYPNTIRYSSKRQIRLGETGDDEVYLLNGQRMSGRYAGLRTYSLYQELLGNDIAFNDCVIEYSEAVGDQNRPAVVIRGWQDVSLHIYLEHGKFEYRLIDEDNELLDLKLKGTEDFAKLSSIADALLMKASLPNVC